jgi:hypothetical protein
MVVIVSVVGLLIFIVISSKYGNKTYRNLGFFALAGHILIAAVVLPLVPYRWDISAFHTAAVTLLSGKLDFSSVSVGSFGTIQSIVYTIFGADPTKMAIVNGLLAVLIPLPAVYLVDELYDNQLYSVDGVVATTLFLPLPFVFLTIPMRDAVSTLLMLSTLALSAHMFSKKDFVIGLVIIPLLAILYPLRSELVAVLLLGIFAGTGVLFLEKLDRDISLPVLTTLLSILGVIGFVLFSELMFNIDRVNTSLAVRASGGAVYLDGIQYASWLDFLLLAPGRAIYFQFAPFPLHVEAMAHALGFFSSAYIIVLTLAAARSLYACRTNQLILVMVLVVYLAGIVGYGSIDSNFGTTVRHRIPFVFLLVVFAAPVVQRWELWVRQGFGVWPDEHEQDNCEHHEAQESDGDIQT